MSIDIEYITKSVTFTAKVSQHKPEKGDPTTGYVVWLGQGDTAYIEYSRGAASLGPFADKKRAEAALTSTLAALNHPDEIQARVDAHVAHEERCNREHAKAKSQELAEIRKVFVSKTQDEDLQVGDTIIVGLRDGGYRRSAYRYFIMTWSGKSLQRHDDYLYSFSSKSDVAEAVREKESTIEGRVLMIADSSTENTWVRKGKKSDRQYTDMVKIWRSGHYRGDRDYCVAGPFTEDEANAYLAERQAEADKALKKWKRMPKDERGYFPPSGPRYYKKWVKVAVKKAAA